MRVEESSTGALAYYENGVFSVRLEPLDSQTKFEGVTLALHEANPGHHLQASTAKMQRHMPEFMKHPIFHR